MRIIVFLNLRVAVDENNTLVDSLIDLKRDSQDTSHMENQIDQMVWCLYVLAREEIGVVEG